MKLIIKTPIVGDVLIKVLENMYDHMNSDTDIEVKVCFLENDCYLILETVGVGE